MYKMSPSRSPKLFQGTPKNDGEIPAKEGDSKVGSWLVTTACRERGSDDAAP